MKFSNAFIGDAPSQRTANTTSKLLLSELQTAHADMLFAMAKMDAVTREATSDRSSYTSARWQLSKASLTRRLLWSNIFQHLMPRVGADNAAVLASLQSADWEMLQYSAAHVGKWSTDEIEANWPAYCVASRALRLQMKACMDAEKRGLYPILERDAYR